MIVMIKMLCWRCDGDGECMDERCNVWTCPDCNHGWIESDPAEVLLTDLWRVDSDDVHIVAAKLRDIYAPWQIKKELRRLAKHDIAEARRNQAYKHTTYERMFFSFLTSALKYRNAAHVV